MSSFNIGKISVQHGNLNHFFSLSFHSCKYYIIFYVWQKFWAYGSKGLSGSHSLSCSLCMHIRSNVHCLCMFSHSSHETNSSAASFLNIRLCYKHPWVKKLRQVDRLICLKCLLEVALENLCYSLICCWKPWIPGLGKQIWVISVNLRQVW